MHSPRRNSQIIYLALLILVALLFKDAILHTWDSAFYRYFPCKKPITYNLGVFDESFGISKEEFLDILKEAEIVWEEEFKGELFSYVPDSKRALKVNLIYDYRQEVTEEMEQILGEVDETRASYDSLREKYNELQNEYLSKKAEYQEAIKIFQQIQKSYNNEVEYWNSKGGAPKDKYEDLKKEDENLRAQYQKIKVMEQDVNAYVPEINAMVAKINDLARKLNINVGALNTIGQTRGEEFTQGEFKSSHGGSEINIYEFSSKEKLKNVLAHELGHALGLLHVEDEEAIMYRLNENKTGRLSVGDVEALNLLCGK